MLGISAKAANKEVLTPKAFDFVNLDQKSSSNKGSENTKSAERKEEDK